MGRSGNSSKTRRIRHTAWTLPLGLLLVVVLCALGAPGSASADIPASVWAPSCSPNDTTTDLFSRPRCIAGARLPSRGWYGANPTCLLEPPLPGMIYPSTTFCGRRGGEAIEQARAIAHLGAVVGGINPDVQWEVGLYQNNPPSGESVGRRRVDVVYYDHTTTSKPLQVYELKQTDNPGYSSRQAQMLQYVNLLNGVTNTGATPGTALADWIDLFLVDTGVPCPGGGGLSLLDVYIGWQSGNGLYDIYRYRPPCFDYVHEPVPRPVDVPVWVPLPTTLPDPIFDPPHPFPGTPWPGPGTGPQPIPTPGPVPVPPPNPQPVPTPPGDPSPDWKCILNPICWFHHFPFPDWQPPPIFHPYGDPHMITLDGLHYDLQSAGEFQAAFSDQYGGLNVQARFVPAGSSWSAASAVAFELGGHTIQLNLRGGDPLLIDQSPYSLASGSMLDFGGGAVLVHQSDGYYASWPGDGYRPALWAANGQFTLYVPQGTSVSGLVGNDDGDPSNDLTNGFGTVLPANSSRSTIHGTFADSWRITQDESLFTYGAGESTDTYTDRSFPTSILTINDLSDSALADATKQCTDANVVDGAQFDDCVLDWALTQDANFLASAAAVATPIVEGGARTADANGAVSESFDGTVAPNFSAARYGSGPTLSGGAFAGPFGHDGRYVFYVPNLPAHSSATIQFDLVAIGDWTTNASSNTVSVDVGGQTVWTGAPATGLPSSSGVLSTGQPYAIYPITVTAPSSTKQLNVGVSASIPLASSRAFGVDNVSASFALVPPQSFDVSLPLTVSNGVPAAGAGNLETTASEDDYRFSAPAGPLQLDLSSCSSSLGYFVSWQLLKDPSGDVAASGAGCGSKLVPAVAAGQYKLAVTRNGATGTYNLSAYTPPSPQSFDVSLPASISNGAPAAGAGNLETTSSEDDYAFSTPADGKVQLDFSGCGSSLGYGVHWDLVDVTSGASLYSTTACGSKLVPNVPAGQYRLVVTRNGYSGTYNVTVSLQPAPQWFSVSLPTTISSGVPDTGAGNLETTSSEDDYAFTTTADGALQFDFSGCGSSLGYGVHWDLQNAQTGASLYSTTACGSKLVTGVPAGQYELVVTRNGYSGTYRVGILVQPPAQSFDITPPASISNGVPAAGAGNLETTASEDDYRFTTTSSNDVQLDFSGCGSSLGYGVHWDLVDEQTGSSLYPTTACGSKKVTGVPAGHYRIVVTRNGYSGTYSVAVSLVPTPDSFNVSLPVSISNGSPAPGAGNLETTSSEDDYSFSTSAAGGLQFDFSGCGSSLGYGVRWELLNAQTGASVYSTTACGSKLVTGVAAGQYKLAVTRNGYAGTYSVGILVQPPVQSFTVSLPASISNGVPAAGAGNLETTASEDDYLFTTATTGTLSLAFSGCPSALGYAVAWKLVNDQSGSTVYSTTACSTKAISALAAGPYRVVVTRNGYSGTYSLGLSLGP